MLTFRARWQSILVLLVGFLPLFVSPDKIRAYHYDIDDHAYREKTNRRFILLDFMNSCGLLCMGGNRIISR